MPRYFFHLDFRRHVVLDEEGAVLADGDAAQREAVLIARDFVERRRGHVHPRWHGASIGVRDEGDMLLFSLPLAEVSPLGLAADLSRTEDPEASPVVHLSARRGPDADHAGAARRLENEGRALRLVSAKLLDRLRFAVRDLTRQVDLAQEAKRRTRALVLRSQAQTRDAPGSA